MYQKVVTFNLWVTPDVEAKLVMEEALRRNYKKIAVVTTEDSGLLAARQAFLSANQGSIEIVLDERFPPSEKDFRVALAKLKNTARLDAILLNLQLGQIGVFAKQAGQANIDAQLFGFETFEDAGEVKISDGALLDSWYATSADPTDDFMKDYNHEFPNSPYITAPNAYDATMIIMKAFGHAKDAKGAASYVRQLKDFSGAMGTYSASKDNTFTLPAMLKRVTKEGFAKLH